MSKCCSCTDCPCTCCSKHVNYGRSIYYFFIDSRVSNSSFRLRLWANSDSEARSYVISLISTLSSLNLLSGTGDRYTFSRVSNDVFNVSSYPEL